jgi:hypothetical protein
MLPRSPTNSGWLLSPDGKNRVEGYQLLIDFARARKVDKPIMLPSSSTKHCSTRCCARRHAAVTCDATLTKNKVSPQDVRVPGEDGQFKKIALWRSGYAFISGQGNGYKMPRSASLPRTLLGRFKQFNRSNSVNV